MLRSRDNRLQSGFSLVETMLTIGVVVLIAGAMLGVSRSIHARHALRDAQEQVVRTLEDARQRAMTGFGSSNHGVFMESAQMTTFEGTAYSGDGAEQPLPGGVSSNLAGTAIIFSRLSGKPNAASTVTLSNGAGETKTVDISADGLIIPH